MSHDLPSASSGEASGEAAGTTAVPPPDGRRGRDARSTRLPRRLTWWQEGLALLVAAVVLAVMVKALVVQVFYIPSASMEPGLRVGDRIAVQKVSYWFGGEPARGDVVVFDDPGGWLGTEVSQPDAVQSALSAVGLFPTGGHLVKRVVGVAGDTIECCDDDGHLLVNGEPVIESGYVAARPQGVTCEGPMVAGCDWSAGPVPEGSLFVMGDNRSDSDDSSVMLCQPNETDCTRDPYVDLDEVVGKVSGVIWPLSRLGGVPSAPALQDAAAPQ